MGGCAYMQQLPSASRPRFVRLLLEQDLLGSWG